MTSRSTLPFDSANVLNSCDSESNRLTTRHFDKDSNGLTERDAAAPSGFSAPEKIWTVGALSKHVGCTDNTIYALIYTGKLKAFMLNPGAVTRKNWRIRDSSWVFFMNQGERPRAGG